MSFRPVWPTAPPGEDPFADPLPGRSAEQVAVRAALAAGRGRGGLPARAAPGPEIPPPPPEGPRLPATADLARLALDHAPAAGNDGPHLILGPWAAEMDPAEPGQRLALVHAVAALAFLPTEPGEKSPFHQWCRRHPLPTPAERAAVRAVDRAPWSAWAIEAEDGPRLVLHDRLGLPAALCPDGPVDVGTPGLVAGPVGPGDTLLARVARGPDGARAVPALGIPGHPPGSMLRSWALLVLAEARLLDPAADLARALRIRGHVLVRVALEWAWESRRRARA